MLLSVVLFYHILVAVCKPLQLRVRHSLGAPRPRHRAPHTNELLILSRLGSAWSNRGQGDYDSDDHKPDEVWVVMRPKERGYAEAEVAGSDNNHWTAIRLLPSPRPQAKQEHDQTESQHRCTANNHPIVTSVISSAPALVSLIAALTAGQPRKA